MANGVRATASGVQNVDAVLGGTKWDSLSITYNFPDRLDYYRSDYGGQFAIFDAASTFQPVSNALQTAVTWALQQQFSKVSNLSYRQVDARSAADTSTAGIDLPNAGGFGSSPSTSTAPGNIQRQGDIWIDDSVIARYPAPVAGDYGWHTILHELGHSVGLKHGHETGSISNIVATADRDSMEFSVMTYRGYAGGDIPSSNKAENFGSPQTLMMYDIAALQHLYGANYNTNSGDTTYQWNPGTGEMFVDGVGQGAPGANRIFMTLWDGNGVDTFDLSNYTTNLQVNLLPEGWSVFDPAQLAKLSVAHNVSARGNVFNALTFHSDPRSLIENVIGGPGHDSITGSASDNVLVGGAGQDTLSGGEGDDILNGGSERDVALYSAARGSYSLARSGDQFEIIDSRAFPAVVGAFQGDGHDTLVDIERVRFADIAVALDVDGAAGMTAKLIGAVFGREVLQQRELVGIGLGLFDSGMTYEQVASLAVGSALGSHSNTDFVNHVYSNIFGVLPSPSELLAFVEMLEAQVHTQTSLAMLAAEHALNLQNINLAGLAETGLEYI
jgi:serralysin